MTKIILILIVAYIVYRLVRGYASRLSKGSPDKAISGEDMVRCNYCGVHLPRSESLLSNEKFFCCEDHRRIGQ